jgi:Domain of unknown function (DUF4340)
MVRKSTVTLLIILGVLVLMLVFVKQTRWWNSSLDVQPTATNSPVLLNLGDKTITAFSMADKQGHILKASLDKQQAWIIEQPVGCQSDPGSISSSLSQLPSFKVLVSLEVPPALADVGLSIPAYSLLLTLNDGTTQTLSVGSIVPTGTGYYVQANRDPVVVVSKYSIDSLFQLVSTVCATPTPEVTATIMP